VLAFLCSFCMDLAGFLRVSYAGFESVKQRKVYLLLSRGKWCPAEDYGARFLLCR